MRSRQHPHDARRTAAAIAAMLAIVAIPASAQIQISGIAQTPRYSDIPLGATEPVTAAYVFANPVGDTAQAMAARTFETYPSGWYWLSGSPGDVSLLMITPINVKFGPSTRPYAETSLNIPDLASWDFIDPVPEHDIAMLEDTDWDAWGGHEYYQTFRADGDYLTTACFRLAHDGIDGGGTGRRTIVVTIHHDNGAATPVIWPQVGPARRVYDVDAGGMVNPMWAVGWVTGEVPLVPGDMYAVKIRNDGPDESFIPYWMDDAVEGDCYRVSSAGTGWQNKDLWIIVGADSDGLRIPYQKCIQRGPVDLAGFAQKWSQGWVAKGQSLAGAGMFFAVDQFTQEFAEWHRATVRVREDGPRGPQVGLTKIARAQNWSWGYTGMMGFSCKPGEIPLTPGRTYVLEFESFGDDGGFNPYMKDSADDYPDGTSYLGGRARSFDLEMIIVEHEQAAAPIELPDPPETGVNPNLLFNGDLEQGTPSTSDGAPDGWTLFEVDPGTTFWYGDDFGRNGSRGVQIVGGSINGNTVDGGYVQRVDGLTPGEPYLLSGYMNASWPLQQRHVCRIGWDPTGQTANPDAGTIEWIKGPGVHDFFQHFVIEDVTTGGGSVSVWVRAATTQTDNRPFWARFDDLALESAAPPAGLPSDLEIY